MVQQSTRKFFFTTKRFQKNQGFLWRQKYYISQSRPKGASVVVRTHEKDPLKIHRANTPCNRSRVVPSRDVHHETPSLLTRI